MIIDEAVAHGDLVCSTYNSIDMILTYLRAAATKLVSQWSTISTINEASRPAKTTSLAFSTTSASREWSATVPIKLPPFYDKRKR